MLINWHNHNVLWAFATSLKPSSPRSLPPAKEVFCVGGEIFLYMRLPGAYTISFKADTQLKKNYISTNTNKRARHFCIFLLLLFQDEQLASTLLEHSNLSFDCCLHHTYDVRICFQQNHSVCAFTHGWYWKKRVKWSHTTTSFKASSLQY